jgi:hypothetical protein
MRSGYFLAYSLLSFPHLTHLLLKTTFILKDFANSFCSISGLANVIVTGRNQPCIELPTPWNHAPQHDCSRQQRRCYTSIVIIAGSF